MQVVDELTDRISVPSRSPAHLVHADSLIAGVGGRMTPPAVTRGPAQPAEEYQVFSPLDSNGNITIILSLFQLLSLFGRVTGVEMHSLQT